MMKKFPSRTIRCEGGKVFDVSNDSIHQSDSALGNRIVASIHNETLTSINTGNTLPPESVL
jgi:hypothetical protein